MTDFVENRHSNLALSRTYLLKACKHLGFAIQDGMEWLHERIIKRYPLAIITAVIFFSFVFSFIQIGKARAERDNISKKLYIANMKLQNAGIK